MKKQEKPVKKKHKNTKAVKALISIPWLWLLFGITLGILISSFIFDNNETRKTNKAKHNGSPNDNLLSLKTKKNYDFYNLLTKSEESKYNSNKESESPSQTDKKPKTLALKPDEMTSNSYIIQAGSFQKLADAEKLKARLALAGFSSNIKSVRIKDKTWYRIQLGPYENKDIAKQNQDKLKQHSITSSMLVRRN